METIPDLQGGGSPAAQPRCETKPPDRLFVAYDDIAMCEASAEVLIRHGTFSLENTSVKRQQNRARNAGFECQV